MESSSGMGGKKRRKKKGREGKEFTSPFLRDLHRAAKGALRSSSVAMKGQ